MATLVGGTSLMSTSCQPEMVTPLNTENNTDSTFTNLNDITDVNENGNANPNDTTGFGG